MTPITFPEQTTIFAKDQPEYQPLPAHVNAAGVVTSCWELSDAEIAELTETKKLWLQSHTFGHALQPLLPSVEIPLELG
jgi:hypothetical protein